jgi:predicted metal-dependent hydrolase
MKKVLELKEVGEIHLYKVKTAKNLRIILRPQKPPRMTVPYRIPFSEAEKFLHTKKSWLIENIEKLKQIEPKTAFSEEQIKELRKKAKNYIPERVQQLSERHNLKYKQVFVKNLKSRWGSCSSANNINLNLHLMKLPEYLIDYVILHELAHTKEKNHGKNFWNLLDILTGNAKLLDKELKKHSIFSQME